MKSWIILQVFRRFHFTVWLFVLIDSCNYVSDGFTYVIISTTTNLVVNNTTKIFNVVFSFKKWLNFPRWPNDVKFYFAICIELWGLGKIFGKCTFLSEKGRLIEIVFLSSKSHLVIISSSSTLLKLLIVLSMTLWGKPAFLKIDFLHRTIDKVDKGISLFSQ